MTVFVGPNNSGKSLVLREIQQYAEHGKPARSKIVEHLEIAYPDPESAAVLVRSREAALPPGQYLQENHVRLIRTIPSSGSVSQFDVNVPHLLQNIQGAWEKQSASSLPARFDPWPGVFEQFVSLYTIALDGRTRFALTEPRQAGDLQLAPQNHLAALFVNDVARARVREITHDAIGLYFVIDPTNLGTFRIRMSLRAPADPTEEQAVDQRSRNFHAAATDIAEASDGVKAFTGLVSALISADYRIILVDEPEAFLHPPLARKLGGTMAALATERKANVFASTHSAHFLMGCIESGTRTNIIRLTYNQGSATARLLPDSRLSTLMRDPLLRSTGVLNALFHASAVVCEADRDRAFYEEINTRLVAAKKPAVTDGVFLNAQNKQTIRRIVQPLREMGIPAAAVVDVDIIKGTDLRDLLGACFVPSALVHSLTILRGNIEARFKELGLDMKAGGVRQLQGADRESFESLMEQLRAYGVFVVPIGEVESWLQSLRVAAAKDVWLTTIFERMRSDPNEVDYVRPESGDVWGFIEAVANWTSDPMRHGMPLE
ncbi:ATP-binding protein [Synechococcus sp. CCAP 1479/9]|uniref:AAA family ATPase n=1 Tax=Synechococcus sp. CCAP 1479/9 TaxID=1221593 RepID=UPI001C2304E7|nr:ATP-binding protein [Synechococcus sp. CCAP 1479/9]